MAIVEVDNLTKYYPKADAPSENVAVVDHVSFAIEKGEIFGILGPNGAGKTTTLEMIEGLCDIDEGSVFVAGEGAAADVCAGPAVRALRVALPVVLHARARLRCRPRTRAGRHRSRAHLAVDVWIEAPHGAEGARAPRGFGTERRKGAACARRGRARHRRICSRRG